MYFLFFFIRENGYGAAVADERASTCISDAPHGVSGSIASRERHGGSMFDVILSARPFGALNAGRRSVATTVRWPCADSGWRMAMGTGTGAVDSRECGAGGATETFRWALYAENVFCCETKQKINLEQQRYATNDE